MSKAIKLHSSSLGQKLLVGLTGLFLCSFLVVHLSGNLLLFRDDGGEAFNAFSAFMSTNPVIRTLEIGLLAGFALHILFGIRVWLTDRRARPRAYSVRQAAGTSSFTSRWAFWTGSFVFVFLVIHMSTFWIPSRFGSGTHSMYELVKTAFENPWYDAFYVTSLVLLGYHLHHGFQSAFQTLGLRPAWRRPVDWVAVVFWLIFPIAFAAMPLFFLLSHRA